MESIEHFLPYLLPPLLGAFIGYVTNYIAIRMLFRPLKPWRLMGVRIPLTPGIIPSKRGELAEKMGDMVGSHLLTSDDVGYALEKESFRRELKGAVGEKLGNFLARDLGPMDSLVPDRFRSRFRDVVDLVRWKVVKAVFEYLESPEFEKKLRGYLHRKGDEFLSRDLESFLTPARYESLRKHMDERIAAFLASDAMEKSTGNFIDGKMEQWLSSERPIREMLPADLVDVVLVQLEKEIPPLLEKFGGMLYDPDFRERLTKKGKEAIEGFMDSLGGLSGLLAGFIDMDKIYGRIPQFLDKAGDEISRWLREETTQKQVAEMLRERIARLLDRSLSAYLENVSYEKVAGVRRFVRGKAIEVVKSRRTVDACLGLAERGIDRLKDRPFGSLLEQALPQGKLDQARDALAERILTTLRAPETREAVDGVLAEKAEEWLFQRPIGKLSARLPADVREELESGLYQQLAQMLKKEIPPLVEVLNVQRMVEEKVNSLDILKVEGLLMGVMKEQFKYINMFGALLGFFIGLVNLLALGLR